MQIQNHERDKELFLAYKKAYASPDVHNFREAIDLARKSKCSQFYVSNDTAWRYVCFRMQGKIQKKSKNYHYIFEMIYKKFLRLRRMSEFKGASPRFVFSFAYTSEAPSFFLSYRRAYDIIRQMKRDGYVTPKKRYEIRKKADTI